MLFNKDDVPFKCNVTTKKCIGFPSKTDSGGYIVHPTPVPLAPRLPDANCKRQKDPGNNQKL